MSPSAAVGAAFGPLVTLNEPAFVHATASLYGKVTIEPGASIWTNTVLRAEVHEITVGPHSNIQDFVMLHVAAATGTHVGAHCSISHHATIHGCTIGDNCLIGINATVMDGAVIGDNSIVAGHCIVSDNARIPPNSIVAGVPGRVVKTRNNWIANRLNAFAYHHNGLAYAAGEHRRWDGPEWAAIFQAERARLEAEFAKLLETGAQVA